MIRNRRGLIVEVTENNVLSAGGNPVTQTVKLALKGLALNMAAELRPYGVAAVAVTPGFLRSETMLERFAVTEETWREGGKKDRNFLESESPLFVGRAVVALAGDPAILEPTTFEQLNKRSLTSRVLLQGGDDRLVVRLLGPRMRCCPQLRGRFDWVGSPLQH